MTTQEFSTMVQKYQALVYTVCHQLVPDVQEAQDLTQETFLAAWRAIDRCPPGYEKQWLARIASNKANECRKNDIAYDFDLNVPRFVGIEDVDICKAYVNIFDNAINAAKALEENRYIKIRSFVDENDGMLYISSENAVAPDYEEKKKKRTGDHGYGLKILEDTAEKYGGHAAANQSGGIFTCVFAARA